VNAKQRKVLEAIFIKPTRANILWSDVEKFMKNLGAEVREGKGSAGVFIYNKTIFPFHRPHPQREAKKYQIEDLRRFLLSKGVKL
jgi:hypothetical protein